MVPACNTIFSKRLKHNRRRQIRLTFYLYGRKETI